MTEQEWLACTDPQKMLELLYGRATGTSDRKCLLLACACCRRVWHLLTDNGFRQAVEFAERHIDGRESAEERAELDHRLGNVFHHQFGDDYRTMGIEGWAGQLAVDLLAQTPGVAADCAMRRIPWLVGHAVNPLPFKPVAAHPETLIWQTHLLRDIFGSPFRPPPPLSPAVLAWNEGASRKMAQSIYDDRAFDRLPVLADALEDAGCTNADMLAHCRQAEPHVRGCWAVDLILGKE